MLNKFTISQQRKGMILYALMMVMFPMMDLTLQYLMKSYPLSQVAFVRFGVQFVCTAVLFIFLNYSFKTALLNKFFPKLLIAVLMVFLTSSFFLSMKFTTLSVALVGFFFTPLITSVLSAITFRQIPSKLNIIAIIIGFIASLLIIRPGMSNFNAGALFAICAGFAWSSILILTQAHKQSIKALELQFFTSLFCMISYAVIFTFLYSVGDLLSVAPEFWQLGIFAGVLSVGLYLGILKAVQLASATKVAPLQYIELASCLMFEFILYSITPDSQTWIGINLIVISGLLVCYDAKKQQT